MSLRKKHRKILKSVLLNYRLAAIFSKEEMNVHHGICLALYKKVCNRDFYLIRDFITYLINFGDNRKIFNAFGKERGLFWWSESELKDRKRFLKYCIKEIELYGDIGYLRLLKKLEGITII